MCALCASTIEKPRLIWDKGISLAAQMRTEREKDVSGGGGGDGKRWLQIAKGYKGKYANHLT